MAEHLFKDLKNAEKIALAGVALLGKDYNRAAFLLCHPKTKTTNEGTLNVAVSRWINNPQIKKYRAELQELITTGQVTPKNQKKVGRPKKDIPNDLTTREGIVKQLIDATSYTEGKDSVSALQTLAKLQGYDKPDAKDQEDRRQYFLPWVSHCRSCRLMKGYIKALQAAGILLDDLSAASVMPDTKPGGLQDQPGQ